MNKKLLKISHKNLSRSIQLFLYTGKVKPLYLAIGDINLLLKKFPAEDWPDLPPPQEYGDYKEPFHTMHYISDRFMAPFRLNWLKYGIENKLFENSEDYFNKDK